VDALAALICILLLLWGLFRAVIAIGEALPRWDWLEFPDELKAPALIAFWFVAGLLLAGFFGSL
jgi:hypothetical protein